jgi:hypothetical protein
MRKAILLALAVGVSMAIAGPAFAQNPNSQKPKKTANQVPDLGFDEPAPPQQGGAFERVIEAVPVTVRADGTIVAELDETFDEAITVSVGADGTMTFDHHRGVANANRAMQLLPSRPFPNLFLTLEKPLFPILEIKD